MFHTTPTTIPTTTRTTTIPSSTTTRAWKAIITTIATPTTTTSSPFKVLYDYNKGFNNLESDIANGERFASVISIEDPLENI